MQGFLYVRLLWRRRGPGGSKNTHFKEFYGKTERNFTVKFLGKITHFYECCWNRIAKVFSILLLLVTSPTPIITNLILLEVRELAKKPTHRANIFLAPGKTLKSSKHIGTQGFTLSESFARHHT